eukprot:gene25367-11029_t
MLQSSALLAIALVVLPFAVYAGRHNGGEDVFPYADCDERSSAFRLDKVSISGSKLFFCLGVNNDATLDLSPSCQQNMQKLIISTSPQQTCPTYLVTALQLDQAPSY